MQIKFAKNAKLSLGVVVLGKTHKGFNGRGLSVGAASSNAMRIKSDTLRCERPVDLSAAVPRLSLCDVQALSSWQSEFTSSKAHSKL